MEKEATIEEKIRLRKKEKAKRRGEMNRRMEPGQPKRTKMIMEEGVQEKRKEEEPKRTKNMQEITTTPKKRKVAKGEERQHKKARLNKDIKQYLTCKRWREEKEEEETRNEKGKGETNNKRRNKGQPRRRKHDTAGGEQTGHYPGSL